MAEIASAFVSLLPSAKGFGSKLRSQVGGEVSSAGKSLGSGFGKAFGIAAGAIAAAGVASFLKDAVEGASDLGEELSKSGVIFGKQSDIVRKFAADAAKSLGQSQVAALNATSTFGQIAQGAGLTGQATSRFALTFTRLASDLASFNNATPEEAIEAIGAAMRGEAEPIRKFGVLLDDATLRATALKYGITDSIKNALTPQQKALAASQAILAQTGKAQGDFARTSGGLANQQRILAAQFTNAKAKLGKALLPVVTKVVSFLNDKGIPAFERVAKKFNELVRAFQQDGPLKDFLQAAIAVRAELFKRLQPVFEKFGDFVRKNPTFVKAFAIALGVLVGAIGAVTVATTLFSIALNSTGIPLVIIAIAALVAGLVVAYKKSEDFREIVDSLVASAKEFGGFLKSDVIPVVKDVARTIATNAQPVLKQMGETFKKDILPVIKELIAEFRKAQPTIQKVAKVVLELVAGYIKFGAAVLGKVLPPLIRFVGFVVRTVVPGVLDMIATFGQAIGKIVEFGKTLVGAVTKAGQFARGVKEKVEGVLTFFKGLPGKVVSAIGSVFDTLYQKGKDLISGLLKGIKTGVSDALAYLRTVPGQMKAALGGGGGIAQIYQGSGPNVSPSDPVLPQGHETDRFTPLGRRTVLQIGEREFAAVVRDYAESVVSSGHDLIDERRRAQWLPA